MASKFYTLLESIIDRVNASVKSVNGVLPNVNGDVIIKEEPINLLDNSDFRDPVNQQGLTAYPNADPGNAVQTIDRWKFYSGDVGATWSIVQHEGISCMSGDRGIMFRQDIDGSKLFKNKTYTLAAMILTSSGYRTIHVTGTLPYGESSRVEGVTLTIGSENVGGSSQYYVAMSGTVTFVWAALYEGEYTADTLPEYKPKDRLVELVECYRYYRMFNFTNYIGAGLSTSEIYFNVDLGGIPMRSQPTVTMVTKPTTVYVEGASASWSVTDSTVELRDYADGDTVLGVYCKSSATVTNVKLRAVRVNNVGFIFDARL